MSEKIIGETTNSVGITIPAIEIMRNRSKATERIFKGKIVPLISEIGKKYGFEIVFGIGENSHSGFDEDIHLNRCLEQYWGFFFTKREWKGFRIHFEFQFPYLHELYYGVRSKGINISPNLDEYLRSLPSNPGPKNKHWSFYQYMDKYRNWDDNFFLDLYSDNDSITKLFEDKINYILNIVKGKESEL